LGVDAHAHGHAGHLARSAHDLAVHGDLVGVGRIAAVEGDELRHLLMRAAHRAVDLAAAHRETVVAALVLVAREEVLVGLLGLLGRQAILSLFRNSPLHLVAHRGGRSGHVHADDWYLGRTFAARDQRAFHGARPRSL